MPFARHSLKTRITLATLAIFVVGIWSLAFYTSRMLREDMQQLLGEQQSSVVSLIVGDVNQELEDRLHALEMVADSVTPAMLAKPASLQDLLEQRLVLRKMFAGGVIVHGFDGTAIADSAPKVGRIGVNYMDMDSIAAALKEGRASIGRPVMGRELKTPIFGMTAPIRDPHGRVIGAVSGVVNLAIPNFLDKIAQGTYGKTGGYMLIAPQHRLVVTASDKRRVMESLPRPGVSPPLDRLLQGTEGSEISFAADGAEVLVSTKRIPIAGWYMAAILPTAEAFAPIHAMQQRTLMAATLLTMLVAGLSWWMLRRQFAPMLAAVKTLADRSNSNLPAQPLPIANQDEIGELIAAFNRVLDTLGQREAALKESEESLAITLHSIGDGVIATDSQGRVTRMNDTAAHLCGWTLAEAPGQPLSEVFRIIDGDNRDTVTDPVARVMSCGEVIALANHTLLLSRDGREYQIAESAAPIRNGAGEIVGVVLVFSDVTERYRVQTALQKSAALFRAVSESAYDAIVTADSKGNIVKWNGGAQRLFGYAEAEVVGQPLTLLMPQRFRQQHVLGMSRVSAGGERRVIGKPVELSGLRKGDVEFPLELSLAQWQSEEAIFFTGIMRDISERKAAEAEIRQLNADLEQRVLARTADLETANRSLTAAKLGAEAANVAKSAFLANMSHEIRTPMNGIVGMVNILRREGVSPKQAERLDKIDTAGKHLLSIINDILDLSKIEAGKFALEAAAVVVSSLLTNVSSILAERARAKGLHLLIEAESLPHNLVGDPTRLQQALLNYAANAVKFTEKGSVTLRAALLEDSAEQALVRFEVQDTGIGIDSDAMARLFGAFEQADNSMTRKYGGTGLGLAITRRLAELMGGEAGAVSTPGVGSTFWFSVRLQKNPQGPAGQSASASADADAETLLRRGYAGSRILVVDDEPINREVAQMQLEAVGLAVDTAEDGAAAIAMAQRIIYAAIFMDMQMPDVNGLEATLQIRNLPGYGKIPIIAMTANAFAEDKARCFAAGMNDFLVKPFDPDVLFTTLLRSLEKPTS